MSRPRMRDHQGSNAMRDATFSRRDMLWAGGALTVGAAFAEPFKAPAAEPSGAGPEPTSWVDSAMPEVRHRMIETNSIRLHVAEQGEGPLVILCHGFPECWYSWRHQLLALAKAGFRAVAPDLRGYGRSDRPEEVEKYTILQDIGDIVGLVDALGAGQAVIAGHDVGATIAWQAALLRPDRFRGVIALGPPFRPRAFGGSAPPATLMPRSENAVFYQLYFQTPEAEAGLGRDIRRVFRSQFFSLSGDRPPSAGGGFPAGMVPRKGAILTDPASLPPWITEADIDVYVAELTRSGFRGPLNWWRNIDRSWELMAAFDGAA
jgi:pimeloyl-ACP methyl ester carboxylesterase